MNAIAIPHATEISKTPRWQARLDIGFGLRAGRTAPVHRRHEGPLAIQRAFYPEGEVCHLYLLHPPGGLVGGDSLAITLDAPADTHALLTTPGATKFYRSAGLPAEQRVTIRVGCGATLEWFPQETIYFDGCIAQTHSRIDLEAGAGFIGWETAVLGRPASGDGFVSGQVSQRFELWRDGMPLLIDAVRMDEDSELLHGVAGLRGRTAMATLVATPVDASRLREVREAVRARPGEHFAATLKGDVLICRFIGEQAAHARQLFEQVWTRLRPALVGRPACAPRIWNT